MTTSILDFHKMVVGRFGFTQPNTLESGKNVPIWQCPMVFERILGNCFKNSFYLNQVYFIRLEDWNFTRQFNFVKLAFWVSFILQSLSLLLSLSFYLSIIFCITFSFNPSINRISGGSYNPTPTPREMLLALSYF